MASQKGLTVRGYERLRIELPVEFVISDEHRPQIRFATSSAARDQFGVAGTTFDLSAGGLGFRSLQFLPRHCEGTIRVLGHIEGSATGTTSAVRLEHRAKVRRVWMNNEDGTYSVGLAFLGSTPALEARVQELLNEFEAALAGRMAPRSSGSGEPGHA